MKKSRPKNKYRRRYNEEEGILFSPEFLKKGLYVFYAFILIVILGIILYFNGYNVLRLKDRVYNMNVMETINLDSIYKDDDVEWISNSDNIEMKNNVVTALSAGDAYVIAKKDNIQVTDVNINVLTSDENISINNHTLNMKVGDEGKVTVKINKNGKSTVNNSLIDQIKVFFKRIFDFILNRNEDDSFDSLQVKEGSINDKKKTDDNDSWSDVEVENSREDNNDNGVGIVDVDYRDDEYDEDIDNNLTFKSSNEKVAVVDNKGNITPVGPGVANIIVEDNRGNKDHTVVKIVDDSLEVYNDKLFLNVGDVIDVEYNLNSNNYTDNNIVWSSSNNSVVKVDGGKVTALGVGDAVIDVKVGNIKKQIEVSVSENYILPSSLEVSVDNVDLIVGERLEISSYVLPDYATDKSLNWFSDNDYVASVSNGVVVGKSEGRAIISATTINGITKNIIVNVKQKVIPVESVSFSSTNMEMNVGDVKKINYTISPSNATDKSVKLNYDKNYVSIDAEGNVKALKAGSTKIDVVTNNNKSASLNLNIKSVVVKISGIKLNANNLEIIKGNSVNLVASVSPSNTTERNVLWKSDNIKVATVDSNGKVVAVGLGRATITVTSSANSNIEATCIIDVKEKESGIEKIVLSANELSLEVGKTSNLTVRDNSNNVLDKNIVWSSKDTKVATVDGNGKVTAMNPGTTVVTATYSNNISSSCTVTVNKKQVAVTKITLNTSKIILENGGNALLKASVSPNDATNKEVKWFSSTPSVVTVDDKGNIKAVGVGNAIITVSSISNPSVVANCNISVKAKGVAVTGLTISTSSKSLYIGDSINLSVIVSPSNATNRVVSWTSSNTKVASVSSSGRVVAKSVGSAIITVKSNSNPTKVVTCTITVKQKVIKVKKLSLKKSSLSLLNGKSSNISYSISPNNATSKAVKWKSSDTSVIKVDSNGKIKAVGLGKAYVSVISKQSSSIKDKCLITVESAYKKKFIDSLNEMSDVVEKDYKNGKKWRYKYRSSFASFNSVRGSGRSISCVNLPALALNDIGIFKSGQGVYNQETKSGSLYTQYKGNGTKAKVKEYFTIINAGNKRIKTLISENKIKAGDIVFWGTYHTNIYAGNNKWFDAGRFSGANGYYSGKTYYFKTFGPVKIGKLINENRKVRQILRFKK